jgi:phosphate transport system permease protein
MAQATVSDVTVPQQFPTAKSTLVIDRLMAYVITVGGITVIIAVLGIFVFILSQIFPLFQGARVRPLQSVPLPTAAVVEVLGVDEWSEFPLVVDAQGTLSFLDLTGTGNSMTADPGFSAVKTFTAFTYRQQLQQLVFGTADGEFAIVDINYQVGYDHGTRAVTAKPTASPFFPIGRPGFPIVQIAYGNAGDQQLVAALQDVNGTIEIHAVSLVQQRTLLGTGTIEVGKHYDLSPHLAGEPHLIAVNAQADGIVVANRAGDVAYFTRDNDLTLRQTITPFWDLPNPVLASMDFLFGSVSLVVTNVQGANRIFSLFVPEGGTTRLFGRTKTLEALPGPASFYAVSLRNKGFLIGTGRVASLRYGTTAITRWQEELPFTIAQARLSGKYDRMLFLDTAGQLHVYELSDPHPEAGLPALFGKIWYEGTNAPSYTWQSTGGTDDFEVKLSLVPLIIGTLKGTLYAMLFATPIALLAALYTSQFLHPNLRTIIKPTMEIMASLPSVILGFLAALWLAPALETRVPSCMLIVVFVPLAACGFGAFWSSLSIDYRKWIKPGYEFFAFTPLLLLTAYVAWVLGPVIEQWFFVVTNPATGQPVADFRLWWPQVTGASFEQRNSLVVGFIMGFAVIPILFTITEDALSNVPAELKSGSLALGASRWQTAIRIVLPTASAGVFSALMIGLGRAVGETMIVLMATGNTPIMDWNIFSGMRTLSANIAVELPEAPQLGTLYRTLFLGAMVLFLMTFVVNTLAEILRQHLREKYRTV